MILTDQHLTAAGVAPAYANRWLKAVQVACDRFSIDTPQRMAGFIGQCAHETGGFKVLEENLNYSADTMATVWPRRFAVLDANMKPIKVNGKNKPNKFALALHRKPEMIANVVYANRMGNGTIESGDGWKYRGRGLKQLTGKENARLCSEAAGVDFVSNPELLTDPEYASFSAAWFWSSNTLSKFADNWDIEGMTKRINGGLIGISDRTRRCEAILALFP